MRFKRFVFMENNKLILRLIAHLQENSLTLPSPYLIPLNFDLVSDTISSNIILTFYYINHEPTKSISINGWQVLVGINSQKLIQASTPTTAKFTFTTLLGDLFSTADINPVSLSVSKFAISNYEEEIAKFFMNEDKEKSF